MIIALIILVVLVTFFCPTCLVLPFALVQAIPAEAWVFGLAVGCTLALLRVKVRRGA